MRKGGIAQLGAHSITIIDVHLPRRFVCFQDGEINITFHALHCFFCLLCFYPIARRGAWSDGGGIVGCNSIHSKDIDTLKYGPGESQQDNESGQNSYCPSEINLNKTRGCSCIPNCVFHGAHSPIKKPISCEMGSTPHPLCAPLCAPLRLIMRIMDDLL